MNKRNFLKTVSVLGASPMAAFTFPSKNQPLTTFDHNMASGEDFWEVLRSGYRIKKDYINLENGYYCFMPESTLEKYIGHIREVNLQGAYYMRTVQVENKRKSAEALAKLAGCEPDELVITRNTTESLDTIIAGFPWQAGDEAVMAEQDYGAMLDMFKQVALRHQVKLNIISVPNHPSNDEELVALYEKAITPRTRLLLVSHMINITGHILPIRKIADMAHRHGVKVLVDGAHAFAHIRFKLSELGCDYYGASLHKWLSVPLGAGILYVRKNAGNDVWPLIADSPNRLPDDIGRLNHTGTHPVATDLTILDAIEFYNYVGPERKELRLRYLQHYWSDQLRQVPGIVVNTPADPTRSCGIANVGIEGMAPKTLAERLLKEHGIYTVAIDYANVHGCRITPNVYTTVQELDVFVKAMKTLAAG
jgi:selenocysteine lyase/cysteine desulfurase